MNSSLSEILKIIEKYFDKSKPKTQKVFPLNITSDIPGRIKTDTKITVSVTGHPEWAESKLKQELKAEVLIWSFFDDRKGLEDVLKELGGYYSVEIDLDQNFR